MPVYKIAGLRVGYNPRYAMLEERSRKYLCDESPDFNISVKDERLLADFEKYEQKVSMESLEYLWMGTAFHIKLLEYNGMYLHSSTVVVDSKAYSFSAPCGTGKSTHTSLWLKHFGDKAFIINDDKAVYREIDGKIKVFGSPFSGKHDINVDTSADLAGICFLERGNTNSIERLSDEDALPLIIGQTMRPHYPGRMELMCDFIDKMLKTIPVYKLKCNISDEAVILSYNTMSNI